jgi:hypothetical protein
MQIAKNRKNKLEIQIDTIQDKIQAYTIGHYEWEDLSEIEKRIYKRWIGIRNLSLIEFAPNQTVAAHLKMLKEDGVIISERTAWNDYRNAMEMWGNTTQISYQAKLAKYEEFLLQAWKIASEAKDSKGLAAIARSLIELAKQLREIELTQDDKGEAYKFVLAVKMDDEQDSFTIDLDSFDTMPNKEQEEMLMDAVDKHNMSEPEFRKLLEEENK